MNVWSLLSDSITMDYVFSIGATLMILGLCSIARAIQGSWISPGAILAGIWSVETLLPLVLSPDYPVYPQAYFLVLLFVATGVAASSLPILLFGKRRPAMLAVPDAPPKLLHRAYWVALTLGALSPIFLYRDSISYFGSLNIIELSSEVTKARYLSEFRPPLTATVTSSFLFLAAILGGYLTVLSPGPMRSKYRYLLFVVPLGASMLISTARAGVAISGLLFVSGMIAAALNNGKEYLLRITHVIWILVAVVILSITFVFAGQLFRWSSFDSDDFGQCWDHTRVYITLHMSVLGHWCEKSDLKSLGSGLGCYTFAGAAEVLGSVQRKSGIFDTFIECGDGISSNIYTAFRNLIEDFTIFGAFIFFALFSLVGGIGLVAQRAGRHGGAACLVTFLSFTFWSPVTSVFCYNSTTMALFLFAVALAMCRARR